MAAEYSANVAQTVLANQPVIFTESPVPCRRGRGPYAKCDSMGRYSSDMSNDMNRDYSHDYSHDGYSRDESGHDSKQELARQLSEIQRKLNTM